jgi:hypothetical protein
MAASSKIEVNPQPEFPAEAPERPSTAVLSLKGRRESIKKTLYTDLQIPRWEDPEVFVRYGPIDNTRTEKAIENRSKQKIDEVNILANADILINSCVGVFACLDGDYEHKLSLNPDDPEGPWTRFDPNLAKNLGLLTDKATDVVRALYITDGDLIMAANQLVEWSAQASTKLDSDFSTP